METATSLARKSWIKRHGSWVIGIGSALLAATLFVAIYFTAGTLFHDSDAFHLAMATASANPVVMQSVGTPLETGRFVSGNMQITPATGHAEFSVPISGPRGHGKLYVEAHKSAGSWLLSVLEFIADGSQTAVDLLPAAPATALTN